MGLPSDMAVAADKFSPGNISEATAKFGQNAKAASKRSPAWYEVGAALYRELTLEGKTSMPRDTLLEPAKTISLPSRQSDRQIPCRIIYPTSGSPSGVMLHMHGGGWVLMTHTSSDPLIQRYADASNCVVVSVGYRLAPEYSFPAGPEDCIDCAEYLMENAPQEYGGALRFIGGESVGSHLSLLTLFHLLRKHQDFSLSGGMLLNFGVYDLSLMPSTLTFPDAPILTLRSLKEYTEAFTPGVSAEDRKSPRYSPLYQDLEEFRGRLPPALFICGTLDPLLDNSILMGAKWAIAGGDMTAKYYPGGCHGFLTHPVEEAKLGLQDIASWLEAQEVVSLAAGR